MSDVERPLSMRAFDEIRDFRKEAGRREAGMRPSSESMPEEEQDPETRRWYILGALKAALLIGGAYVVGLGLLIALLILFWQG